MKKKIIIFSSVFLLLVIGIVGLNVVQDKNKKVEPEWSKLAKKYNYIPYYIEKEKNDIFDGEYVDIYIVSEKLDSNLIQKPLLSSVYSWKVENDNRLGILIPETLGLSEVIITLPGLLDYHFSIQKSYKETEKVEINQPLLQELLKSVEYVELENSFHTFTTN